MRKTLLIALSLSTLLASACADDPDAFSPARVCDIREQPCQRRAAELAAYLRGRSEVLAEVEVAVVDAAAFIDEAEAAARQNALSPRERAFRAGLRALGASDVPSDRGSDVRARYEQTGALYRHAERRIIVLDRGEKMSDTQAFSSLVHEMTHALQGAEGLFERERAAKSDDAWLASRAMIEGEAMHNGLRAYAYAEGWSERELDWSRQIGGLLESAARSVRESSDLYRDRVMLFPYAWGLRFVLEAHASGGTEAVRGLFADGAPRSTAAVMRGYLDTLHWPDQSAHDVPIPSLAAPWQLSSVSHLGAWLLAQVAARQGGDTGWARSVIGDSVSIFEAPPEAGAAEPTLAAFWRIELADAGSARTAAHALGSAIGGPEGVLIMPPARTLVVSRRIGAASGASTEVLTWEKPAQEDLNYETVREKRLHGDDELACPRLHMPPASTHR